MGLRDWISDRWEEAEERKKEKEEADRRIEKEVRQARDFRRKVADDFYFTDEGPPLPRVDGTHLQSNISKRELLSLLDANLEWEKDLERKIKEFSSIEYAIWYPRWRRKNRSHSDLWLGVGGHRLPNHQKQDSTGFELTKDGKRLMSLLEKLHEQRWAAEKAYRSAFRAEVVKQALQGVNWSKRVKKVKVDREFDRRLMGRSLYWIHNEIKARAVKEQAAKEKAAAARRARAAIRKEEEEEERRKLEKKREKDRRRSLKLRYQKLLGPIPKKRMGDDKWIRAELVKAEKKAEAHSKKLSKFFKDQNISDELQKMVKRKQDTSIDDVAYIHARGWVEESNMHPVINSILNKKGKGLTVDDGDYLFRYREHKALLEALAAGKKRMDWAKQLLESGFADNVKAMDMVVGGMSVAAARKAYGLGPGPDPVPVPIPDIDDDDFDPDDEDNELLL